MKTTQKRAEWQSATPRIKLAPKPPGTGAALAARIRTTPVTLGLLTTASVATLVLAQQFPRFRQYLADPETFLILAAVFLAFFVLAGLTSRAGRGEALALIAVTALAYPVAKLVSLSKSGLLPVRTAVGHVSYLGYPKLSDYLVGFALLLLASVIGLAAGRLFPAAPSKVHGDPAAPNRHWPWWTAAVIAFVAVLYQANLSGTLWQYQNSPVTDGGWDAANITVWRYLTSKGLLPYRDFWYPYSGQFLLTTRLPWGPLVGWLHSVVAIGCLFFGLLLASGKRVILPVAVTALLLVAFQGQILLGWWRYVLAIDVVLLFTLGNQSWFSWAQAWRTALTAYVVFFEPAQFSYAVAGIAAFSGSRVLAGFRGYPGAPAARFRQAALAAVREALRIGWPALVGIAIVLSGLAWAGMLSGFIEFHRTLSEQSVYSAFPADVPSWTRPALQGDVIFLAFLALGAIAVYSFFRDGQASATQLGVWAAGALCLQKLIMRPHMMRQFAIYSAAGIGLYVISRWSRRSAAQSVVACGFAGMLTGVCWANGVHSVWADCLRTAVSSARENYDLMVHGAERMHQANAARFAPWKFSQLPDESKLASTLRNDLGLLPGDQIYVMGDDSYLYILLSQLTPFQVNMYNGSPLFEQNGTVAWLERHRPRFVIWDEASIGFDAVPHVVRVPQIFRYVQTHYEPVATTGRFHVLRRAAQPGDLHLDFWRERLGTIMDLGHIPRSSSMDYYPACGGTDCQDVIQVRFERSPAYPRKSYLRLNIGGNWYMVFFDVVPDQNTYTVNLSRVWFWPESLAEVQITAEPDASVLRERKGGRSSILY